MRIGKIYLNKNRIIILCVAGLFLISYVTYLVVKYKEEVKMAALLLLAFAMVILVGYVVMQQEREKRSFRTPEEESAYRKRTAELQAERDHRRNLNRPKPPSFDEVMFGRRKR